jgi:hypothetical protein
VHFNTTQQRNAVLTGHNKGVHSLAYHSTYHQLISVGYEHDAYIWNPFNAKVICKLKGHFAPLVGVAGR